MRDWNTDAGIDAGIDAAAPPRPILTASGLEKAFDGVTALRGIDLAVQDGEFLTIVGPSGSGKTTLVRLLAGLETPSRGAIRIRGSRVDHLPANRRPSCMVFQSLALFPHLSAGENIAFPLKIRGLSRAARRARALELLALLHLPESHYGKRIQHCSGGERQRIALARALAFDPEILFFDEPLAALDFRLRKALEKELKDLHERTRKTFLYITHSLEEAMVMSDRIAILRAGRFEQIGTPEEIYARPASRFVAEFMGEVNLFATSEFGAPAASGGTLVVRPEVIRFLGEGETADVVLHGILCADYDLGSRIQYAIELDSGRRVTVEALRPAQHPLRPGQPVRIGWALDACHRLAEG